MRVKARDICSVKCLPVGRRNFGASIPSSQGGSLHFRSQFTSTCCMRTAACATALVTTIYVQHVRPNGVLSLSPARTRTRHRNQQQQFLSFLQWHLKLLFHRLKANTLCSSPLYGYHRRRIVVPSMYDIHHDRQQIGTILDI